MPDTPRSCNPEVRGLEGKIDSSSKKPINSVYSYALFWCWAASTRTHLYVGGFWTIFDAFYASHCLTSRSYIQGKCKAYGLIFKGDTISVKNGYGVDSCRNLCQREGKCNYWTYNMNRCTTLKSVDNVLDSSGATSGKKCWRRPKVSGWAFYIYLVLRTFCLHCARFTFGPKRKTW